MASHSIWISSNVRPARAFDLKYIVSLMKANYEAVGFLPEPRIAACIAAEQVILAEEGGWPCGYLLFGGDPKVRRIYQACIQYDARRRFGNGEAMTHTPRSKYGAVKTEVDGIVFDSKKEARRYQDLKLLERAGKISHLTLQPRFVCEVQGVKICTYVADFQYVDLENSLIVTEDAKGVLTPTYRLKKKLVRAIHGIEIQEV